MLNHGAGLMSILFCCVLPLLLLFVPFAVWLLSAAPDVEDSDRGHPPVR